MSVEILQEVYDTRGKGLVLSYRYDCERAAPTCIAAHPGEPVLAVGLDHNLLILQVGTLFVCTCSLRFGFCVEAWVGYYIGLLVRLPHSSTRSTFWHHFWPQYEASTFGLKQLNLIFLNSKISWSPTVQNFKGLFKLMVQIFQKFGTGTWQVNQYLDIKIPSFEEICPIVCRTSF